MRHLRSRARLGILLSPAEMFGVHMPPPGWARGVAAQLLMVFFWMGGIWGPSVLVLLLLSGHYLLASLVLLTFIHSYVCSPYWPAFVDFIHDARLAFSGCELVVEDADEAQKIQSGQR